MTSNEIESAVARMFDFRRNVIVPNVSYGFLLDYEADMLIVSSAGYVTEIEIKVSLADLKADFRKSKFNKTHFAYIGRNEVIKRMFYALPDSLEKYIGLIPNEFGVIIVTETKTGVRTARIVRGAKPRKGIQPISQQRLLKLCQLGCMRIWSLKEHIMSQKYTVKFYKTQIEKLKETK